MTTITQPTLYRSSSAPLLNRNDSSNHNLKEIVLPLLPRKARLSQFSEGPLLNRRMSIESTGRMSIEDMAENSSDEEIPDSLGILRRSPSLTHEAKTIEVNLLVRNLLERLNDAEKQNQELAATLANSQKNLEAMNRYTANLSQSLEISEQIIKEKEVITEWMKTPQYIEHQGAILEVEEQLIQLKAAITQKEKQEEVLTKYINSAQPPSQVALEELSLLQTEIAEHRAEYEDQKRLFQDLHIEFTFIRNDFFAHHQELQEMPH